MNRTYVRILKNFIHGEQFVVDQDIDKLELTKLAYINSTVSILAKMMAEADKPDDFLLPSLRSDIGFFALRAECMKELKREFEKEGIDVITFKGYVVREYYPVPELRTFGDIDLVIRKEDRGRCDDLMISLGFERKDDWEPVYSYTRGGELYEIHTEVLDTDVSEKVSLREYFSDIWSMAYCYDRNEYRLREEEHFIYLLTHLAKHISGAGAGIRMYMDIALYIRAFDDSIDWVRVRDELTSIGLFDFASTVLDAVEDWFEVAAPFEIKRHDADFLDSLLEFTLSGGTFGYVDRDSAVIALKNEDEDVSRAGTVFKRMFPSADTLAPRYTYLEKSPWMLPFAWIHRVFKNREKIGSRVKEAERIMSADSEDVVKLRNIYKEMGL